MFDSTVKYLEVVPHKPKVIFDTIAYRNFVNKGDNGLDAYY